MSNIKRYIEDKIDNMAKAVDEPYDIVHAWFFDKIVNVPEDRGEQITKLAKTVGTTYEDVFEYYLLALWYRPKYKGEYLDPLQFVAIMLMDKQGKYVNGDQKEFWDIVLDSGRNQNETGTQDKSVEAQSDTM